MHAVSTQRCPAYLSQLVQPVAISVFFSLTKELESPRSFDAPPPQQHRAMYNGLARPADYSTIAQKWDSLTQSVKLTSDLID